MELENIAQNDIPYYKVLYFKEGSVIEQIKIVDVRFENIAGESLSEELFWYTHPHNWSILMKVHLYEIAESRMTSPAVKAMKEIAKFSIPYVVLPDEVDNFEKEFQNTMDALIQNHNSTQIENLLIHYQQIRREENGDEPLYRL